MSKILKITLGIAETICGIFLLIVIGLNIYFQINYNDFYAMAKKEFKIPGLSSGFTPQGITVSTEGVFLTSGYMKDGSASRIYLLNDRPVYVELMEKDGTADTNHAGGLAVYGDYLYLTNERTISVYNLADVLKASPGDRITSVYNFPLDVVSAFVHVEQDKLYVGEFYREENYPTDKSHHLTTDAGNKHYALMAVYALSKDAPYGFVKEVPEYVYSITGLAQGVCLTGNGKICLSTSYGTASSHIYIYEDPAQQPPDLKFEIAGTQVPLFYLDDNHLEETIKLFPMTEELIAVEGRIYVMCESACNKYIFGKFTGNNYLYSFPEP
ncbi:MAG: hypothetical protein GX207_00570 [Peptococcaceae bacterium]|nr:hypothetical protein [Peptococcaceae bacterium]